MGRCGQLETVFAAGLPTVVSLAGAIKKEPSKLFAPGIPAAPRNFMSAASVLSILLTSGYLVFARPDDRCVEFLGPMNTQHNHFFDVCGAARPGDESDAML